MPDEDLRAMLDQPLPWAKEIRAAAKLRGIRRPHTLPLDSLRRSDPDMSITIASLSQHSRRLLRSRPLRRRRQLDGALAVLRRARLSIADAVGGVLAAYPERCDDSCPGYLTNVETGRYECCDECKALNGITIAQLDDDDIAAMGSAVARASASSWSLTFE